MYKNDFFLINKLWLKLTKKMQIDSFFLNNKDLVDFKENMGNCDNSFFITQLLNLLHSM